MATEGEKFIIPEEVDAAAAASYSSEEEEDICHIPPPKVPRLLAKYSRHRNKSGGGRSTQEDNTARSQLTKYLEEVRSSGHQPAMEFWQDKSQKLPALHRLAWKVLSVPASSAPVERVFSRGGIIMRPHRTRLSAEVLSSLMFLKCNEDIM